jgi:predicted dehydrogenase
MSEPLSVLIVGCGDIAGGYDTRAQGDAVLTHAGAYAQDVRFLVKACVDPDADRRRTFMARWNVAAGYDSLDACLATESGFDVASVCLPTDLHAETLARLLGAGQRLVFAEKPVTGDPARSRALVEAFEAKGVALAVNYLRRWDPAVQTLKAELAAGKWGRVQAVGGIYAKGLFNCASHFFDLVHFLVGPLTPKAVLGRVDDGRAEDPTLTVHLETEGGVPVMLTGVDGAAFFPFELDLVTEKGRITLEDLGLRLRTRTVRQHPLFPHQPTLDEGTWADTGMARAMAAAVGNIFDHLHSNMALASTGRTALAAEELCSAILKVAAKGDVK